MTDWLETLLSWLLVGMMTLVGCVTPPWSDQVLDQSDVGFEAMELHNKTGSTQPRSDSAANVSPEDSQSPASKERAVTQTLEERFSLRGDRQQRRLSQVQQPQKLEDVAEAQMEGSSKKGKV